MVDLASASCPVLMIGDNRTDMAAAAANVRGVLVTSSHHGEAAAVDLDRDRHLVVAAAVVC